VRLITLSDGRTANERAGLITRYMLGGAYNVMNGARNVDEGAHNITYPGKPIFLSFDGNQNYYTSSLILLVRTNCVVIFVAIK
jgi:hypothetical protein